ncbi:MAG TPA: phospholipase D family protein [Steroidobacteraceae bacterium]
MRSITRLLAGMAALFLAGCVSLPPRMDVPPQSAVPLASDTWLDTTIGPEEAKHPGQSGFRLVSDGPEAFAIRARSALAAGRSLDVQTYIWHDDGTGTYLAYRLLEAADRGVKVRLLVDDMDARNQNYAFGALDAHPNIEVRLFNPFQSRSGKVSFAIEAAGSFTRINRRMHNKSWIADNRIALVGGRNLGDEYFGASKDVNFSDLDFALVGPVVRDASAAFDRYWNSPLAYPVSQLSPDAVSEAALAALRKRVTPRVAKADQSHFAEELRQNDAVQRLIAGDWPMEWSSRYRFVADDPAKALGKDSGLGGSDVLALLGPVVTGAKKQVTVISPYFVPGEAGTNAFVTLAQQGTDVRILTNSLAANDVAMVYGGYSTWRKPLLKGGVHLWELKPTRGQAVKASFFGSSGSSLHTKALTTDGQLTFVGSYNLDPRSTSLNCEQGVFVDSPAIAAQLEAIFAAESSPQRAWRVTLEKHELHWSDGTAKYDETPDASFARKFQAWFGRVFPVSSQL